MMPKYRVTYEAKGKYEPGYYANGDGMLRDSAGLGYRIPSSVTFEELPEPIGPGDRVVRVSAASSKTEYIVQAVVGAKVWVSFVNRFGETGDTVFNAIDLKHRG
jgi:hypothetical protein